MSQTSNLKTNPDACPLAKKCGGCQLLNMDYEEQLSFKQVKTIRLLGRFCHVDEILGMENPYHYRNKVQAAFTTKNGKIKNNNTPKTLGARKIPDTEALIFLLCFT